MYNLRGGEATQVRQRSFNPVPARTRPVAASFSLSGPMQARCVVAANAGRRAGQSHASRPVVLRRATAAPGMSTFRSEPSSGRAPPAASAATPASSLPPSSASSATSAAAPPTGASWGARQRRPNTSPAPSTADLARPSTSDAVGRRADLPRRPHTSAERLPAMLAQAASAPADVVSKKHVAGPWWYATRKTVELTDHGFQSVTRGYYINRESGARQWEFPEELQGYKGGADPAAWRRLQRRRAKEAEAKRRAAFEAAAARAALRSAATEEVVEPPTAEELAAAERARTMRPKVFQFSIDPAAADHRSTTTAGVAHRPGGALNHNYRATAHLQQRLANLRRFGRPKGVPRSRPKWSVRKPPPQRHSAQRLK